MTIHRWVAEPPGPDVEAALARLDDLPDVVRIAVMPDVHLAHDVCIGTVVATRRWLLPAAIGGDVGCGVATLRTDGDAAAVRAHGERILQALAGAVPIHRHRAHQPLPDELHPDRLPAPLARLARREGSVQVGTIGRGNHFLELQADEQGRLWIMVHTGSRAVGPAIQAHHRRTARIEHGFEVIDADSDAGRAYLRDLAWAEAWATWSRQRALAATAAVLDDVLGARPEPDTFVDCGHNHVRCSCHDEGELWVHRKGAISARPGEPGLIPGSMGDPTFHVEGRGLELALCSSSHGAGRAMSRTEARHRISAGELRRQLRTVCFDDARARRLTEEAPSAYKSITAVMRAQRPLTRVVRKLTPVLSHKG
jgi:tRNA-splicing ligase RtcB